MLSQIKIQQAKDLIFEIEPEIDILLNKVFNMKNLLKKGELQDQESIKNASVLLEDISKKEASIYNGVSENILPAVNNSLPDINADHNSYNQDINYDKLATKVSEDNEFTEKDLDFMVNRTSEENENIVTSYEKNIEKEIIDYNIKVNVIKKDGSILNITLKDKEQINKMFEKRANKQSNLKKQITNQQVKKTIKPKNNIMIKIRNIFKSFYGIFNKNKKVR